MKKVDPATAATIALAVVLALVMFFPRSSQEEDRVCTDDDGCSLMIAVNDNLSAIEGRITKITLKLTADQAALFKDPNVELERVKSTLTTYSPKEPRTCSDMERSANNALWLFVEDRIRQTTEGNTTPITLCENLAPIDSPTSLVGES